MSSYAPDDTPIVSSVWLLSGEEIPPEIEWKHDSKQVSICNLKEEQTVLIKFQGQSSENTPIESVSIIDIRFDDFCQSELKSIRLPDIQV